VSALSPLRLARRALTYYWRTNLAVVLGIATAVAVLAGALIVGDTVRGSLRDLVTHRLGKVDHIVQSNGFFREALAQEIEAGEGYRAAFGAICPIVITQGQVTDEASGRRAATVDVYGVDDRFWQFHGVSARGPQGREALMSAALAAEIGAAEGATVLVRVQKPSAIPIESLHGRKDNLGRTLRLTARGTLGAEALGDFSLRAQQGSVRAIFVPLGRLQQDLDVRGRVNTLLLSRRAAPAEVAQATLERLVRANATPADLGVSVRALPTAGAVAVESAAGMIEPAAAAAAQQAAADLNLRPQPVLTYLANTIRAGDREVPYSLVAALDLRAVMPDGAQPPAAAVVLNDWTARELAVGAGDSITLDYYVWEEPGRLVTRSASFQVSAVVPIGGLAADRELAPVYPGISDARSLSDWDPPFPVDLHRVRRVDEEYWTRYRTTPKAFISLDAGQRLWGSRYGDETSVRIPIPAGASAGAERDRIDAALRRRLDPFAGGMFARDVRTEGLAASRGATDFGEYFTYFSFFLVISALLLAALFFRLGLEQRAREIGLLRSAGFPLSTVRWLFVAEASVLAVVGAAIGIAGALGYGRLMAYGLRTWWAGAVGTSALTLHARPLSLVIGAVSVYVAAIACIWWTLRSFTRITERALLAGDLTLEEPPQRSWLRAVRKPLAAGVTAIVVAAALLGAASAGLLDATGGFFAAGGCLLIASVCLIAYAFGRRPRHPFHGHGWWPAWRLGLRSAAHRPGRSVLAIAVIASAVFILISVDAFRQEGPPPQDRHSGVGGYPLLVDLLVPIVHDPNGADGRADLGLPTGGGVTIEPFRVLPGDDASCLNLYEPTSPRMLGLQQSFLNQGRFAFRSSLAQSGRERENPWLLLNRDFGDDTPVIADANSMTYVLHKQLGDTIVVKRGNREVRLRLVAALSDSIFQSELLMSEASFLKLFPEEEGYRFLLVDVEEPQRAAEVSNAIEKGAADLGADATSTVERLAAFHTVENTYISTFQALGGLGLLVGTIGLAAVVLRNVLERRRELALLGAVGYAPAHITMMVLGENLLLLGLGVAVGAVCALIAIAPAAIDRGGHLPAWTSGALLVAAVFGAGLLSSVAAARAALRARLLEALRAE
jgi:ABC-type lipoprotein release transport system permease subunit